MKDSGYGFWGLVVFNALLFIVFAARFFHPKTKRDWGAMGAFSASWRPTGHLPTSAIPSTPAWS